MAMEIKIARTHMSAYEDEVLSEKVHMSKIMVVYIKFRFELPSKKIKGKLIKIETIPSC